MNSKSKRPTRVVILINELLRGGAQRIVLDIARSLDYEKYSLEIVYLKSDASLAPDSETVLSEIKETKATLVCLEGAQKFSISAAIGLYQYLRKTKPDVLQTFLPYAGVLGRVIGLVAGVRNIVSVQCNLPVAYDQRTYWLDRFTLPLASVWIGATEGIENSYGGSSESLTQEAWVKGRRHFTIVAGVDLPRFDERFQNTDRNSKREELNLPEGAVVVMMVARLISWKGHPDLIEALTFLPASIHLVLVGWGPLQTELSQQSQACRVQERVHFLGARNDVIELLAVADVYVQAHSRASDGNIWMGPNTSQMEACAAKIPSVSTAVPLVELLIQDGKTGYLAKPNDSKDLARAILKSLHNPVESKEMAIKARERIEQRYSVAAMVHSYQILYDFLTNNES